ncbi:MAG: putative amidohydrolase YtcJ [Saprospiraceae bacterium]|jgi:predicted amidohydrolase YtcJ
MTNHINVLLLLFLSLLSWNCQNPETADTILVNGTFYTVDGDTPIAAAIAIKGDRILKIGTKEEVNKLSDAHTLTIDLEGHFAMPGFIEGHGHFSGLGKSLINLNFLHSKNWQEIVDLVAEKAKTMEPGEWIEGRGWHQEKWNLPLERQIHGYPYHDELSAISPDNPVILYHASGHGLFANKKAMALAGVNPETPDPSGGSIIRDNRGEAIGVFEERAMTVIRSAYQEYLNTISDEKKYDTWIKGIELAQVACLENGITSFQDAGSSFLEIDRYKKLAEEGKMDIRLWAMLRHSYADMNGHLDGFPIIDAGDHYFTCKAIKSEVDGALGSFGAWLLRAYHDKPNFVGQNTTTIEEVKNIASLAFDNNLQFCVHAIGDRANREVLNIYDSLLTSSTNKDLRWRIEHAQHLDPVDIPRFKTLGVIASMQGIHCTSDAPFVVKRLGEERSRLGAYPWRSLLDNGVVIANGTDTPVEDISAIECLYASVTRKRSDSGLEFFPEQRMTRKEALYSYTLGNAFAAFEEKDKGSLTPGKLADIVVLSNNLVTCSDEEILDTEILFTIVGGKIKYQKKQ